MVHYRLIQPIYKNSKSLQLDHLLTIFALSGYTALLTDQNELIDLLTLDLHSIPHVDSVKPILKEWMMQFALPI